MTPRSIVIITDSFEVLDLKTVLNKAVLQTANLSKVVKRRRTTKGTRKATERERGKEEEDGEQWRWTRRSVRTDQTRGEMEGEEGRNGKMNERKSDKNSCF